MNARTLIKSRRKEILVITARIGAFNVRIFGSVARGDNRPDSDIDFLVKHPRVIASPHIGAQTVEAQSRTAEDIAHEVLSALRGKKLRWKVT